MKKQTIKPMTAQTMTQFVCLGFVSLVGAVGCLPTDPTFGTQAASSTSSVLSANEPSSVSSTAPSTASSSSASSTVSSAQPAPASTSSSNAMTTASVVPASTPAPVPAPRASSAANIRVCPKAVEVAGVDVSDYDPGVQWNKVQISGDGFAFVKVTEGTTYVNKYFSTDWPGTKAAGILRGPYHFFHPNEDATAQAEFFLKELGTLGANDLPAVLDWEVDDGMTAAEQVAGAQTWLALVEKATGKTPIVYVAPGFWNALGNPQGFERYPLFIANYDESCPDVPPPWTTWTFWQKSGTGTQSGISGQADLDTYIGSLSQLSQFAQTPSSL